MGGKGPEMTFNEVNRMICVLRSPHCWCGRVKPRSGHPFCSWCLRRLDKRTVALLKTSGDLDLLKIYEAGVAQLRARDAIERPVMPPLGAA